MSIGWEVFSLSQLVAVVVYARPWLIGRSNIQFYSDWKRYISNAKKILFQCTRDTNFRNYTMQNIGNFRRQ